MEERSNSSSVSSPTLEDILDSLLALRRPNKKPRAKANKGHSKETGQVTKEETTPISDWQERMNQPLDDTAYFPTQEDEFFSTANPIASATFFNSSQEFADSGVIAQGEPVQATVTENSNDKSYGFHAYSSQRSEDSDRYRLENSSNERRAFDSNPVLETALSYELGVSHNYEQKPSHTQYNEEPAMDQDVDENAFGIPTEIQNTSSSGSAAVNVLANLNDSNPSTPARHRRVSFDLDVSDKDEKSSSRSRRESESLGGSIHCRNSKCGKTATGLEARREFKTCHNCNAYYCSRECRRAHWEKHKKVCMQSRVGALCKQIINHVKEDSYVVQQLSGVARRGVLAKGRGCVKLFFSSPDRAERFLTGGLPELPEPWYIPCGDILPEEMGAQTFSELSEQCRTYNGENRFVLYVSVCVVNEVPTSGAVKWEREMISRSAKLRLVMPKNYEENQLHHQAASTAHLFPEELVIPPPVPPRDPGRQEHHDIPRPTVSPPPPPLPPHAPAVEAEDDTLILKSVPPPTFHTLSGSETRKLREVSFANIQRHLVERGVDLRQTYPDIYTKLCNYVENDETFLPVTIYPKNSLTGKHFMCVIMPDCTTSADTTIDELPNPLTNIPTGSRQVETINIAEPPTQSYDLR